MSLEAMPNVLVSVTNFEELKISLSSLSLLLPYRDKNRHQKQQTKFK